MKKSILLILAISSIIFCSAQDYPLTDSLKRNLEQATSNEQKVIWLGELASFYMNVNNNLADQYGANQLEIAELSRDRGLIIKALLLNADRYFNSGEDRKSTRLNSSHLVISYAVFCLK